MAYQELISSRLFADPSLKGYYRMEGNSNDSKGTQNGTDTGTPVYSSGSGFVGQGVLFDSNAKRIDISNAAFAFTNSTPFTVMCWLNQSSFKAGGYVISYNSTSGKFNWDIAQQASGFLSFNCGKTLTADYRATGSTVCTASTFFHIVGTYDGNNNLVLYVNGGVDATAVYGGGSVSAPDGSCLIGNNADDLPNRNALIKLDEVAILNRKLSAAEVAAVYNGTFGISGSRSFFL